MKQSVEKRLSAIEKRLEPGPPGGPIVVFIRPVEFENMTRGEFDAAIKALGADRAAFILPRPGDADKTKPERDAEAKLKEAAGRAFVVNVVNVQTGPDPEPSDAELEAEIARLESELEAAKVKS